MKKSLRAMVSMAAVLGALGGCSLLVESTLEGRSGGNGSSACSAFPDGTPCRNDEIDAALVCRGGRCELSMCGDGVVDDRTEDCDDGNDAPGDGCEPTDCAFSCEDAADCDDGEACNGVEACGAESHACEPGTPPADGETCTAGSAGGACRGGDCVPVGCGDGMVVAPEECEPGSSSTGACQADCTWTCTADPDCSALDTDPCDGTDTCDEASHVCGSPSAAPVCEDDGNPCTLEACRAGVGCQTDVTTNDQDGDGAFATGCGGTDCDDANASRNPSRQELCADAIDNDCNPATSDTTAAWYVDCDGDGFAPGTAGMVSRCERPAGPPTSCGAAAGAAWTGVSPLGRGTADCNDAQPSVYPGQTSYFGRSYMGVGGTTSFDYDCNGVSTPRYSSDGRTAMCTGTATRCSGEPLYVALSGTTPVCGGNARLNRCGGALGAPCTRTTDTTTTVVVECH